MAVSDAGVYLEERVEKQISYHAQKAAESRRRFRRLAAASTAATALTPLLIALDLAFSPPSREEPLQMVLGILPVAVAVVAAVATASLSVFKHRETWVAHRSVCEALKREAYLFRFSAGPYAQAKDAPALLVERAEALMESEGREWKLLQAEPVAARDGARPR